MTHPETVSHTGHRRIVATPDRGDLVDAALLMALMALALVGLRATYDGVLYLVAGLVGAVLGVLIAYLASILRQPMIAVGAATLAVFFLAGGAVALHGTAVAGVLPTESTLRGLASESVHGWKDLLTTLPPVDGSGPLLVLPYILGLLGGVGGYSLARRTHRSAAPVIPPLLVLAAVILLGTNAPAARLLQGAVFGVVALAWTALRARRLRPVARNGSSRRLQLTTAACLLAVAGAGGALVGPHLPGVGHTDRTVLRSYVRPPVNLDQYPSPLAGFRRYKTAAVKNTTLFRVDLPDDQLIRLATLDDYNATVWTATDTTQPTTGGPLDAFQRIGTSVPAPRPGRQVTYTVTVPQGGYSDVWLPMAGELTSVEFHGADARSHALYLRYNLATGTALLPDRLQPGDSYTVHAVLPVQSLPPQPAFASPDAVLGQEAAFLAQKATTLAGASTDPMARLTRIADTLHAGYYSDGIKPNELQYLPGHYQTQLERFLGNPRLVGDDEQYAAAFALLLDSQSVGIPARVVLGAAVHGGRVTGADVHAWVEVRLTDGSWRTISYKRFMPDEHKNPQQAPTTQPQTATGQKVPPPVASRPRGEQLDTGDVNSRSSKIVKKKHAAAGAGGGLPGWLVATVRWGGPPVLVVLLVCGGIVLLKTQRRRRRRTRGTPASRFSTGWRELIDHARDLGVPAPAGQTRREQARALTAHDVAPIARRADAHVFGPHDPQEPEVAAYWQEIDAARRRMSSSVSRRRRLWAALNLTTFFGSGRPAGTESA